MFRLFLSKKLNRTTVKPVKKESVVKKERRALPRYEIDHKHLTIMNDQDIFLLKDLSVGGFSSSVSDRAFDRLNINDQYLAKLRYLGEIYDLEVRVSRKSQDKVVGFEIINIKKRVLEFLNRVLYPLKIAASFSVVDAAFMKENETKKIWYHGDGGSDFYIWQDSNEDLTAWQLVLDDVYIEWAVAKGLETGKLEVDTVSVSEIVTSGFKERKRRADNGVDQDKRQQAIDVIVAGEFQHIEHILQTLMD